jgi:hypothetical protein
VWWATVAGQRLRARAWWWCGVVLLLLTGGVMLLLCERLCGAVRHCSGAVNRGLVLGPPAARCTSASRVGAVDVSLGSDSSIFVYHQLCSLGRERRNWFSGTEPCVRLSLSSHVDNLRAVSYPLPCSVYSSDIYICAIS